MKTVATTIRYSSRLNGSPEGSVYLLIGMNRIVEHDQADERPPREDALVCEHEHADAERHRRDDAAVVGSRRQRERQRHRVDGDRDADRLPPPLGGCCRHF